MQINRYVQSRSLACTYSDIVIPGINANTLIFTILNTGLIIEVRFLKKYENVFGFNSLVFSVYSLLAISPADNYSVPNFMVAIVAFQDCRVNP
jgi:hypothetical protein